MRHAKPLKLLTAGAVVALAGGLLARALVERRSSGAMRTEVFDFGVVRAGEVVSHTFSLNNPGSRALRVVEIKTSCACTVVNEPPAVVPPRGAADVPVRMTTQDRSGPMTQSVYVKTLGGPPALFVLRGETLKDAPDRLTLPRAGPGDRFETSFFLSPFPGQVISVRGVEYDDRLLVVRYARLENGAGFRFGVRAKEGAPPGRFESPITIYTDDSFRPVKTVSVEGDVAGRE